MEIFNVEHDYYCSDKRYDDKEGYREYYCFEDFFSDWGESDLDYNLVFRWDIEKDVDNDGNELESFVLKVYYILQRKGLFVPVIVHGIKETDRDRIIDFLKPKYKYLLKLWEPFRKGDNK
jgi:hypothetical protein